MITPWRNDLASTLGRLEVAVAHWKPIWSFVMYIPTTSQMIGKRVGDFAQLRGEAAQIQVKGDVSLPYRLVVISDTTDGRFGRLTEEMTNAFYEIRHPRIGTDWEAPQWIGGDSLIGGLLQWLLALHAFARGSSDAQLVDIEGGQDCQWDGRTPAVSLIADTALASAKMADWILRTESIGLCPVELGKENEMPRVFGKEQKILTNNQYAVMQDLCRAFPLGLSEEQLGVAAGLKSPRHVLLQLMGKRSRSGNKANPTVWAEVILNPGKAGLGWRIKPA